jgi:hypothetical protein
VQIRNLEQLLPGSAAGVNQGADISIALSDYAVEGGDDAFEGFERCASIARRGGCPAGRA